MLDAGVKDSETGAHGTQPGGQPLGRTKSRDAAQRARDRPSTTGTLRGPYTGAGKYHTGAFLPKAEIQGWAQAATGSFPTLMRPRLVVVRTPPGPKWGVHLSASRGWGWQEAVPPPGQQEQKPVAPPWGLSPRTGVSGLVPRRPRSLACRGPSPPVSPVSSRGRCPSERVCVLISSCKVTTQLALGPTWGPHFTLITP